jgi:hypothetical protein
VVNGKWTLLQAGCEEGYGLTFLGFVWFGAFSVHVLRKTVNTWKSGNKNNFESEECPFSAH